MAEAGSEGEDAVPYGDGAEYKCAVSVRPPFAPEAVAADE